MLNKKKEKRNKIIKTSTYEIYYEPMQEVVETVKVKRKKNENNLTT